MRALIVLALLAAGLSVASADTALAEVKRFAHWNHSAAQFALVEQPDGTCETHDHTIRLTFEADGTLHCRLNALPEGYQLEIWILSFGDHATVGDRGYHVSIRAGQAIPLASETAAFEPNSSTIDLHPAWWVVGGPQSPIRYGPFPYKRLAITITLDAVGLEATTVLDVDSRSTFSIGAMSIVGLNAGTPTYQLVDGRIESVSHAFDYDSLVIANLYVFSIERNAEGKVRPGRYAKAPHDTAYLDQYSVVLGVAPTHLTNGFYVGLAVELTRGLSFSIGWHPHQVDKIRDGYDEVSMVAGSSVPTRAEWEWSRWAAGFSLDTAVGGAIAK